MSKQKYLNSNQISFFCKLLKEHTGLVVREQDLELFSNKIYQRLEILKLKHPEDYYHVLNAETFDSTQEWNRLITLLTNNESYFFRDKQQFNLLRNEILPKIIQRNQIKKTIRICSAGCSTGQEPYSLAILLQELLPDFQQWNVLILGVDINQIALQEAKKGIYASWSFRGVETQIKQKYFKEINNQYHLNQEIKKTVNFQQVNLVKDSFPQQNSELKEMDLIICRNVFIYFDSEAIAKAIHKIYHTLQPLGYLITGHTELAGQDLSLFEIQAFADSIVYQRPAENISDKLVQTQIKPTVQSPVINRPSNIKKSVIFSKKLLNKSANLINNVERIQQILSVAVEPNLPPSNLNSSKKNREAIEEANQYWQQKQYSLAIQKLHETIANKVDHYEAYQLMAQIYADMGKYDEAKDYCQQALQIDSLTISPYYLLAQIAEETGNRSEAKKILKQIIYLERDFVAAYLDLSQIYRQEGNRQRALKMQQAALDILKKLPPDTQISVRDNLTTSQLIKELETGLQN